VSVAVTANGHGQSTEGSGSAVHDFASSPPTFGRLPEFAPSRAASKSGACLACPLSYLLTWASPVSCQGSCCMRWWLQAAGRAGQGGAGRGTAERTSQQGGHERTLQSPAPTCLPAQLSMSVPITCSSPSVAPPSQPPGAAPARHATSAPHLKLSRSSCCRVDSSRGRCSSCSHDSSSKLWKVKARAHEKMGVWAWVRAVGGPRQSGHPLDPSALHATAREKLASLWRTCCRVYCGRFACTAGLAGMHVSGGSPAGWAGHTRRHEASSAHCSR